MKGIAGFYYVRADHKLYECKAKGSFRNQKLKPLVGDLVEIEIQSEEELLGNIVTILPRNSELIRPAVSNVDQIILVFAADKPEPNRNLIDRFLIMMDAQDMHVILCVNKCDLVEDRPEILDGIVHDYGLAGYEVIPVCASEGRGIDALKEKMRGHVTAFAGPSGVGKSTLVNQIVPEAGMETGTISVKIERGKHTTRHSECFPVPGEDADTILMDTPGFATVYIDMVEAENLEQHFPEFRPLITACRYIGCAHIKERGCAVRQALTEGKIAASRYENYCILYDERKNARRY